MGKELLTDLKYGIFQIWLDTRPKMEMHDPNVYPTILGGVSRGFWSPFEDFGAQSAIFWYLKTGTFAKSARFQVSTFAGFRLYLVISESMFWQEVRPSCQFRSVGHEQHFHGVHIQLIFRCASISRINIAD